MKKKLLLVFALFLCIASAKAQDIIVLKNGQKIEGKISTDRFSFEKLFYLTFEDGEEVSRFIPVNEVNYVTLAKDGNDYLIERYNVNMTNTPGKYDYRLVQLKKGNLHTAPYVRHGLYLEAGVARYYIVLPPGTYPMLAAKYLYFPSNIIGIGVMAEFNFAKNDPGVNIGDRILSSYTEMQHLVPDDIFYIGPVFSLRHYINNLNTFLFADISAGYAGTIQNRYDITLDAKKYTSTVTAIDRKYCGALADHIKFQLRIGGESLVGKDGSFAITYGLGLHFLWSVGKYDGGSGLAFSLSAGVKFGL